MKNKATFNGIFVLLFFFAFVGLKAQEQNNVTYKIIDNAGVSNIQPYIDALNASNLRFHRLKDSRNTITFDSGVKVLIYSATEIAVSITSFDPGSYPVSFPANKKESTFTLGANNFILERYLEENIKK